MLHIAPAAPPHEQPPSPSAVAAGFGSNTTPPFSPPPPLTALVPDPTTPANHRPPPLHSPLSGSVQPPQQPQPSLDHRHPSDPHHDHHHNNIHDRTHQPHHPRHHHTDPHVVTHPPPPKHHHNQDNHHYGHGRSQSSSSSSSAAFASASSTAASVPAQDLGAAVASTAIATAVAQGLPLPFVHPSSYLRPRSSASRTMSEKQQLSPLDRDQMQGLRSIREFLKVRTSYDVFPMSFRLILLDTRLTIKKSLNILVQNNIVSAPLWDSRNSTFMGLLTSTDYINVIQYYCQFPDEMSKLDQLKLGGLRHIEKAIGAMPLETLSVNPNRPLYEACRYMLKTRARRIPLVDVDDETGCDTVFSVITQYRILKFIAVNNEANTLMLKKTLRSIGLGTYTGLATAGVDSTVLDVVDLMVKHNISCVPIVDEEYRLLNLFEAVDIIACLRGGAYEELSSSVGTVLCRRPDSFPGILTCHADDRLDSIFETIRKSKVHRLIVIDDDKRLQGIISLSDILKYVLLHGEEDEAQLLAH